MFFTALLLGLNMVIIDSRNIQKIGKVAVLGGGFAGLSVANKFIGLADSIHIYDANEPGLGGASAVSAGLMHPMTPRGIKIWKGIDGFTSSMQLLQLAQEYNSKIVFDSTYNIIKPLRKYNDYENWKLSSIKNPNLVEIISSESYNSLINSKTNDDTIIAAAIIKKSCIVDCPIYLQSLLIFVRNLVKLKKQKNR
jgi:protoporphyrinogen oxidase